MESIKVGTERLILSLCEKEGISRRELYKSLEAYLERVYTGEEQDERLRRVFSNMPGVDPYLAWRYMDTVLHGT